MMTLLHVALGAAAGLATGFAFFRLLWWTTQKAVNSRHPVAVVSASFIGRSVLAVAVLGAAFLVAPSAGLATAAGFVIARHFVVSPVREGLPCD